MGLRGDVAHVDGDLVAPDIGHIGDLHFQSLVRIREVIDQGPQPDVVEEGAHIKFISLIRKPEMGHLRAEDLPVVLKSLEKKDRFPGPGPSNDQEEGISGRAEHGAGMKTVNLMVALQRDQKVFEEKPQVSEERIAIIGALLLVAGEIPGGKEDFLRHFDLRLDLGIVNGDEIGIEIFAYRGWVGWSGYRSAGIP